MQSIANLFAFLCKHNSSALNVQLLPGVFMKPTIDKTDCCLSEIV